MGFMDDLDFSSLADLFGGKTPASVSDAIAPAVSEAASSAGDLGSVAPDLGQFAADSTGAVGGFGDTFLDGMPAPSGTPVGMPAGLPAATVTGFQVAPGQGSAVVGTPFGGPDDTVPATAHESQVEPWWKGVSGGDVNRSAGSPFYSSTPGVSGMASPEASIASAPASPPPTFMDKLGTSFGKVPGALANAPSQAVDAFAANPIGTTAKAVALGAPLIAAGINAANAPKAPGRYTLNPPTSPSTGVAPLPGTSGTSSADIPAASPMSTTLTGQGGFKVNGQGLAGGGIVRGGGYPEMAHPVMARRPFVSPHPTAQSPSGLRAGGSVGVPKPGDAQAEAVMAYLEKMAAARQSQGAR